MTSPTAAAATNNGARKARNCDPYNANGFNPPHPNPVATVTATPAAVAARHAHAFGMTQLRLAFTTTWRASSPNRTSADDRTGAWFSATSRHSNCRRPEISLAARSGSTAAA